MNFTEQKTTTALGYSICNKHNKKISLTFKKLLQGDFLKIKMPQYKIG